MNRPSSRGARAAKPTRTTWALRGAAGHGLERVKGLGFLRWPKDRESPGTSRLPPARPVAESPHKTYWLPRTIRPTREGWWLIGATCALGLAATNTGNNLLYLLLAMMLSFLAVSGLLSEQTMRGVRLQREVPRRLFAGVPAPFAVRLANGKRRLPSYALHVAEGDPSGAPPPQHFFLRVSPQAHESWTYSLTFPHRGRQPLSGLRLFTRFPFGLFTKSTRPLLSDSVLVYPTVRPLTPDTVPAAIALGWRVQRRRGRGADLYNLRPYRPGDDPRLLHWKTSARVGHLILQEHEEEERPRVRLVLEDPTPEVAGEAVEGDLSYAASLATHAIRLGILVELVTAESSIDSGMGETHLDRILERLALYARPAAPRPVHVIASDSREVRVRLGRGPGAGWNACASRSSAS